MRFTLLTLTLALAANIGISQQQANYWYFGNHAGIDFSSGTAVPVSNGGNTDIVISEGSSSIADRDGNLLFYTYGAGQDSACVHSHFPEYGRIWNPNHVTMANGLLGDDDAGGYSARQSALIIPKPGTIDQYYLFTTDEIEWESDTACTPPNQQMTGKGLRLFEIDMSMNSGLGEVVVRDQILLTPSFEALDATVHSNGYDYWIIAMTGWNDFGSNNDSIVVFKTDQNGVSLVSKYPANTPASFLKFSPDASKIYCDENSTLYSFDNATGVISNPQVITNTGTSSLGGNVNATFSPNSRYLYIWGQELVGFFDYYTAIYQYDLQAADISASKTLVGQTNTEPVSDIKLYSQLQIGPDGKIYIAKMDGNTFSNSTTLDVIHCPNKAGVACNYQADGFTLAAGTECSAGLPNFVDFWLKSEDTCGNAINANYTYLSKCTKEPIQFMDMSSLNVTSWSWNFDDPSAGANNNSTLQDPTHVFSTAGIYDVQLIVSDGIISDSITFQIEVFDCVEGISQVEGTKSGLKSVPNPFNDYTTMKFPEMIHAGELVIFDELGNIVRVMAINESDKVEIQAEGLKNGLYFVSVITEQQVSYKSRIVVMK